MLTTLSGRNLVNSTPLFTRIYGQSVEGRDLFVHGKGDPHGGTLLVGGLHGDERATTLLLETYMEERLRHGLPALGVAVIPVANPDGYHRNSRYNASRVDLNRNCERNWSPASEEPSGRAPWSEPESRALRDLILGMRPTRVVSLHWALAEIDADGPQSTRLARAMWETLSENERAPYRLRVWEDTSEAGNEPSICPGSFGQWCGFGLRYPDDTAPATVTLELPYDPALPRPDILPDGHLITVRERWEKDADGYMKIAEKPVHKMLDAACGPL
jgi:hypothetical protein